MRTEKVIPAEPEKKEVFEIQDVFDDEVKFGINKKVVNPSNENASNVLEQNKQLKDSFDIEILTVADIFKRRTKGGQHSSHHSVLRK